MYLIPKPKKVKQREGNFFLGYKTRIVVDVEIQENGLVYASILKGCIEKWAGLTLSVLKGRAEKNDIYLKLDGKLKGQEYRLMIAEGGVTAVGGDGAGVLYAVETLCQVIEQCGGVLDLMEICDVPDIKFRGYYLDETRGRVLKLEYLKGVVDRLCRYKINEFQLYIEHTYLFRGLSEMWRDETPLTAEEIMELDCYCKERHIDLIPSLASFGHLYTLLSTKVYGELCELTDSEEQPFSFVDRMRHHTVNVSDHRVLPLIKGMLEEYMVLFSSNKFNLCADETFDLGKGRAKELARENGVHRIYIDYVKELCQFLLQKGKQPMFWGDVICGEPFLVQELPKEIICLTWGYAANQREDESKKMAETGVMQYLCPGVGGWNQWMNLIQNSYENIVRMCTYAKKYKAIGILNTDWGDFGHVNDPEYSVPGMIYGAAFSWNQEVLPFEEINRQIAVLEYKERSGKIVNLFSQISKCSLLEWWDAVMYYEMEELSDAWRDSRVPQKLITEEQVKQVREELEGVRREIKRSTVRMDSCERSRLWAYDITIEGILIWNEIGVLIEMRKRGEEWEKERAFEIAKNLETWFMSYKELWRKNSKEGDLHHVSEIIFWYADLLRDRKRQRKKTHMLC